MDRQIHIIAVRRESIDLDKLAAAVLRLAREQAAKGKAGDKPQAHIKRAS
jgi:hypothetical protein